MEVVVESFGYGTDIPDELKNQKEEDDFCLALERARDRVGKDVVGVSLSWSRPSQGSGAQANQFTITHPRLYYGRNYFFVFTYYKTLDKVRLTQILKKTYKDVFEKQANNFSSLVKEGLTGEKLDSELKQALSSVRLVADDCENPLINRDSGRPDEHFANEIRFLMLKGIAEHATKENALKSIEENKKILQELDLGFLEKPDFSVQKPALNLRTAIDNNDWITANNESNILLTEIVADSNRLKIVPLVQPLANLSRFAEVVENIPPLTLDDTVDKVVNKIPLPEYQKFISTTSNKPYLETMNERLPFIMSLDGGLIYVDRFEEIIPTIGVNIKLNRKDFDDPLDKKPEYSFIVGFGLESPDDLDPNYRGIFGRTGNRSLLLGIGLRFPGISPLLRVQFGALLYKQEPENPLIDDLETKYSLFGGLSMNWDAIDFASRLFSGRSNINF
ncbi:MAG: hypothetical protein O7G31_12785 [Calditrichaeota bacterium]|nr:hypothetical protein [Calditrichota bacterium]